VSVADRPRSAELYRIDRQEPLPLYAQIERNLRDLIQGGRLQPGQHVPPEWELAELYGVSRLTVRRALDDLVRQDWLNRRHGVGTFVSRPAVAAIAPSKLSFTQEMLAIGRKPSSRLLSCKVVTAPQSVNSCRAATLLLLDDQAALVEIVRLRLADDLPLLLETAYLSSLRFPDLESDEELAGGSLYERMSTRYGVQIARVDQTSSRCYWPLHWRAHWACGRARRRFSVRVYPTARKANQWSAPGPTPTGNTASFTFPFAGAKGERQIDRSQPERRWIPGPREPCRGRISNVSRILARRTNDPVATYTALEWI